MQDLNINTIPPGYLTNGQGHLVPSELVSEIDKTRNDLVMNIVNKANELRGLLYEFKAEAFGDIQAFAELSAEKYGIKLGGIKGNISLSSFDGRYQVKLSQADVKIFDERLHAAKELVDLCIHRWTEGSRIEIKALVEHAFQTDKEGKISLGRIYTLMNLDIQDEQWQQAMQALKDSMQVVSTTAYLRIYERDDKGKFEQLALDLAGV
jgi:hypothetical protein